MYRFYNLLILSILHILGFAGNLELKFAYYHFYHPETNIYTETHFNVNGKSVKAVMNATGKYTGSVLITMSFYHDDNIIQGEKIRISLPETTDTSYYNRGFTAKSQFRLPTGKNILKLDISDENNPSEKYHFEIPIQVPDPKIFKASDVILIAGIPDSENREFSKKDIIPYISADAYLYDKNVNELLFYVEFYDVESTNEKERPFFVNYYLESQMSSGALEKFAGRIKIRNEGVHPILGRLNITELPSGFYNLVIESINRKNEIYERKKVRIERISDYQPVAISLDMLENFSLDNSIIPVEILKDSVYDFLLYMLPIATYSEQKTIDRLLSENNRNLMMKYFNSFWVNKQKSGITWEDYYNRVLTANKLYGTRLLKGYRTDRGRVYCLYGAPTIVESRKHEPNTYPYEIWQYDQLIPWNGTTAQTDRIFIFADREINTGTYRLIHSTAAGETFNERWQYLLMERDMWTPNVDDVELPAQAGDWGTRFNNSIIINPTKFGRYNRW